MFKSIVLLLAISITIAGWTKTHGKTVMLSVDAAVALKKSRKISAIIREYTSGQGHEKAPKIKSITDITRFSPQLVCASLSKEQWSEVDRDLSDEEKIGQDFKNAGVMISGKLIHALLEEDKVPNNMSANQFITHIEKWQEEAVIKADDMFDLGKDKDCAGITGAFQNILKDFVSIPQLSKAPAREICHRISGRWYAKAMEILPQLEGCHQKDKQP